MIYKTFEEWAAGNCLEDGEPRKEAYTKDELLLIEMGWGYGFDAGAAAMQERCAKECEHNAAFGNVDERYASRECAEAIRALDVPETNFGNRRETDD